MQTDFPFASVRSLTFKQRPRLVSANLRPLYRVTLLLLVLRLNCSRGTASLLKLQFFNWMLKSDEVRDYVRSLSKTQSVFTLNIVHMDPMVNLALRYAFAEGLVRVTTQTKYGLTDKGRHFADVFLESDDALLTSEREFLVHMGTAISEVKIQQDLGVT